MLGGRYYCQQQEQVGLTVFSVEHSAAKPAGRRLANYHPDASTLIADLANGGDKLIRLI